MLSGVKMPGAMFMLHLVSESLHFRNNLQVDVTEKGIVSLILDFRIQLYKELSYVIQWSTFHCFKN